MEVRTAVHFALPIILFDILFTILLIVLRNIRFCLVISRRD